MPYNVILVSDTDSAGMITGGAGDDYDQDVVDSGM